MGINNFEVGSIFTIEDRATGVLTAMAEQLERIDTLAESVKKTFSSLGRSSRGIDRLTDSTAGLGEALATVATSTEDLRASFASSFSGINAELMNTLQIMREMAFTMGEISVAGAGRWLRVSVGMVFMRKL